MKSTPSLTLIVCLVASALPVTAQEKGPLARAVTREAVRLAAVQSGGTPAESNWSRVRGLASGTDVVVTVQGSKPARRRMVQADESTLTVQNPSTQGVEAIAQGDVLEIRTEARRLSSKRKALGLLGGLGGVIGGAFVGAYVGKKVGGCDAENLGCMGVGMMAGVVGGAVLGYRAVTSTKGDLIYRAPQHPAIDRQ